MGKAKSEEKHFLQSHPKRAPLLVLFFFGAVVLFCLMEGFDMVLFCSLSEGKQTLKYQILSHNGLSFLRSSL